MKWEVNSKRQQELVQDIREKFAPPIGLEVLGALRAQRGVGKKGGE